MAQRYSPEAREKFVSRFSGKYTPDQALIILDFCDLYRELIGMETLPIDRQLREKLVKNVKRAYVHGLEDHYLTGIAEEIEEIFSAAA